MSAAHVRRGSGGRASTRKSAPKVAVPKKIAKKLPVSHARANKIAGLAFGGFMMGGSLDLLAHQFPDSRLRFDRIGAWFGESGFGPVSRMVTSALEGGLFSGGVVTAMRLARRNLV